MKKHLTILLVLLASFNISAEMFLPMGMYARIFKIRTHMSGGTAFTIDVDEKKYVITAKHVVGNSNDKEVDFVLWDSRERKWRSFKASPIYPSNSAVDIAALDVGQKISEKDELGIESTLGGISPGQQVSFLGYPLGLSSAGAFPLGFSEIPFIKSGILSAMDTSDSTAKILYIDGQNNPGFSGGPVVFYHSPTGKFRIGGVVAAYKPDPVPVLKEEDLKNPEAKAYQGLYARANSGIVVAYSIEHIVDAIKLCNSKKQN